MGGLNPFAKPKVPLPAPAPAAPTAANSAADLAKAQAAELEKMRKQRGRAATMLTGGQGVTGDDTSGLATKALLGGK